MWGTCGGICGSELSKGFNVLPGVLSKLPGVFPGELIESLRVVPATLRPLVLVLVLILVLSFFSGYESILFLADINDNTTSSSSTSSSKGFVDMTVLLPEKSFRALDVFSEMSEIIEISDFLGGLLVALTAVSEVRADDDKEDDKEDEEEEEEEDIVLI